ncbi:glycine cleavage system aminomethyltransferase GcvT [Arenibaculum pallidiluteum]|uniref:glycine cleavage system aminomethyltransferase GcvT n=1 Tax=Arenibaculum pallidiluteum TaxID=2812559 RepID=UPI001A97756F|nr:glycine cleavage system aminomethyltransferase GcvT [Arenibaculum pallidiluteum]
MAESNDGLKTTPLHALHQELGGRMVPFAGYAMPVQYPLGILREHLHTRDKAGLFDVSHMGQLRLRGDDPAGALETLVPGDLRALAEGRIRYTLLTNERAGILDDLMVTRAADHLFVVVNAATKDADIAHLRTGLGDRIEIEHLEDRALLALQGPAAAAVLAGFVPDAAAMAFMSARALEIGGIPALVSRSGYTGEDGYEISVEAARAEDLARMLLARPEVEPIGLGARDSLRLEAGLCLYGHDIDETTTPVEAALTWTISKRRRAEGGYPGDAVVAAQLRDGPGRLRVGIRPDGRAPAREHTEITGADSAKLGEVTSGGFGPTVDGPVAMGYVPASLAAPGTPLTLLVRGKPLPARVATLPFAPHRYHRG